MNLDLGLAAALGLLALVGFFSGAIKQISHWIGLALAFVAAKPLGMALAPSAAAVLGWPQGLTAVGLSAALMPVIVVVTALVSRAILNAIIPGEKRNRHDRTAGAVLGAAKGGLIAWALLSVVVSFEAPLSSAGIDLAATSADSSAMAFARGHNFFDSIPASVVEGAGKVGDAGSYPKGMTTLLDDPAVKGLLTDSNLMSVLSDPAIRKALQGGDTSALMKNADLKKLLENPELKKALENPVLARKLAELQAQAGPE